MLRSICRISLAATAALLLIARPQLIGSGLDAATKNGAGSELAATTPAANAELAKRIDAVFERWNQASSPGASIAIIQHGQIIFEKGYGAANLEYSVLITPETVFHVASVSKQFTAMAVVLLEEDGKLSLEDDVHRFLPELPDYGAKITIRNLLQHTSGIRDQWQTLGLAGWSLQDVITQDQILRMLFRQKELNFPPGTQHLYSNSGFTLLAEIVHRVSGEPFPQFCAERIFRPLGMTHSAFHLRLEKLVPGRAYSYESGRGSDPFVAAPLNYANVGATSLFTTPEDLVKWLDNFRDPKVGGPTGVARLQERAVLTNGKTIDYGLGIGVGFYKGHPALSHDGGDAGFRSSVLWLPDQQLGIAVVANLGSINPANLAHRAADLFIDGEHAMADQTIAKKHVAVKIDPTLLDKYTGSFEFDDAPGFVLTYTRDGDHFYGQATHQPRFEIFPESPTTFFYKVVDAQVTFHSDPDGTVNRIVHHQGDRDSPGHRIVVEATKAAALQQYAGTYWSEELETEYTFFVRDGKLFGIHAHHGEFPLSSVRPDHFETELWFAPEVHFVRGGNGQITAAILGGGRVKGVRFDRKPPVVEEPRG